MPNVLFVNTVYRVGEKMYPVITALAEHCVVDVINLLQMSTETSWIGTDDPREFYYDLWESICSNVFNGPRFVDDTNTNGVNYSKFMKNLDSLLPRNFYDLVIIDNNITLKGGCISELYSWFHKQNIPVVGCPHGNRNPKGYGVLSRVGRMFDQSFVFGEKEKKNLLSLEKKPDKYKKHLICGGIPSNDVLVDYERKNEYILIIPNITEPKQIRGPIKGFKPFTKEVLDHIGVLDIASNMDCNIVIKEKNKMFHRSTKLQNDLRGYKNVDIIMDCKDENKLIAGALYVISAPSTMAFKSIQMGIPTAMLKGHGMLGNFKIFPGLVDCDARQIRRTLRSQDADGICTNFIKETLFGGLEFKSTKIYVEFILESIGYNG